MHHCACHVYCIRSVFVVLPRVCIKILQSVEFQLLFPIFIWAKMDGIPPSFNTYDKIRQSALQTAHLSLCPPPFPFPFQFLSCVQALDVCVCAHFYCVRWIFNSPLDQYSFVDFMRWHKFLELSFSHCFYNTVQILWPNNSTAAFGRTSHYVCFDSNFTVINKTSHHTNI